LAQAVPAELGGIVVPVKGGAAEGSFNEFDGTFHHANGARYFPNGNKVDGVNHWLAQAEPGIVAKTPEVPATPEPPINKYDGTTHKDGKRFFPDGKEVGGVNNYLTQAEPGVAAITPET
jgi:hypothetical protein